MYRRQQPAQNAKTNKRRKIRNSFFYTCLSTLKPREVLVSQLNFDIYSAWRHCTIITTGSKSNTSRKLVSKLQHKSAVFGMQRGGTFKLTHHAMRLRSAAEWRRRSEFRFGTASLQRLQFRKYSSFFIYTYICLSSSVKGSYPALFWNRLFLTQHYSTETVPYSF